MTAETEGPDPTASLLAFFGSEAHRMRTEAGWSQQETAKKALATQAMISYIESAKRVPSAELAAGLDAAFGTGGHFMRLHPLVLRYAYPSWFLPYVELEREAQSIRTFDMQLIPGLLQTEDYARAIFRVARSYTLNDLVAARMSRQSIFEREDRPRVWFVIDEQALRRPIGGAAVMRAQLTRLLQAGEDPSTVIQVIPASVAEHPGLNGPFTLLGFDEGEDVLYVDAFTQGRMGLGKEEVAHAAHSYDLLRAVALSHEASAELIAARLEEFSR
ncbi:helix-turn-helix domain-containing protein [Kitasatospora mediocidica]|uniref:helix-turn-helix domain-containing protein n=1 Tax=Kitasatospora mediocidica TaxID=58352 RepID=UPI00056C4EF7|nr:helix-turn-helix transcriptional regulator [Kitasatospora mediocidica]